jgi:hypothetical protein
MGETNVPVPARKDRRTDGRTDGPWLKKMSVAMALCREQNNLSTKLRLSFQQESVFIVGYEDAGAR